MEIILASTSVYRRELLSRLGVFFKCEAPGVDESQYRQGSPRDQAERLALLKAEAVRVGNPNAVIIGSDQVVALGKEVLGKPGDKGQALTQLKKLAGQSHSLYTAVVILAGGKTYRHTDETRLEMRDLSDDELERYLDHDEPFDCAGSYKIESRGIALFEKIESADFTAIQGLPLIAVTKLLRVIGVELFHDT